MPLRAEFTPHLADPSPESWREICRLLDDPRITASQHMLDVHRLADELAAWPPEIERPPLKHWHDGAHAAELRLCLSVREVDLYRHYIDAAASAPALPSADSKETIRSFRIGKAISYLLRTRLQPVHQNSAYRYPRCESIPPG